MGGWGVRFKRCDSSSSAGPEDKPRQAFCVRGAAGMTVESSAMQLRGDNLSTEQIHEKRWLIHSVMSLGLVLVVMLVSSVNVALPTLVRDLGSHSDRPSMDR